MDKALIKIQQLEKNLKEKEDINLQNEEEIVKLMEESFNIEYEIEDLEKETIFLECKKNNIEEAPQKRRSGMKNLINALILLYILMALIIGCLNSLLVGIGATTVIMSFVASIVVPIMSNIINEKYPIGNLDSIEKDILANNSELNILNNKKKELEEKMKGLQEIRINSKEEIESLKQKINSIILLRTEVINEFCNNNLELDKKIDHEYENKIVKKEKVKVVK